MKIEDAQGFAEKSVVDELAETVSDLSGEVTEMAGDVADAAAAAADASSAVSSLAETVDNYKPMVYNNVVLTSSVEPSGDPVYPYLNTFTISGIDDSYIPTVILSNAQVLSGDWASTADTISNGVTVRTKVQLENGTTIPQIICQKADAA